MNILIISPFLPYPANQGGKIRVFNLIKYLSRQNRVTLACLSAEKTVNFGPLDDYCAKIVCVERPTQTGRDLAGLVLGKMPFNYQRYHSREFRSALTEMCQTDAFDAVQVEMPMLWQYADIFAGIPTVLDTHNVEYDLIKTFRLECRNPFKKALYSLEEKMFKRWEELAWQESRCCFAVSDTEREIINSQTGSAEKAVTVPNAVDLETFMFQPKQERNRRILFLGGMDWAPNLDSAEYFLDDILPHIYEKMPDAEIDFVGKDLWKIKSRIHYNGIRLNENVPEILPWFHGADVLVVPLRQGAGTRIKIIEAMAAGLPVVTTSKGCDGTNVVHEKHLLIADTAQEFAKQTVRLIEDGPLAVQLAQEARQLVEMEFSWEMGAKTIHNKLSSLL